MAADDPIARLRVIVIGAQKGGSTGLARALGRHPEIHLPERELPLFEGALFTPANRAAVGAQLTDGDKRLTGLKRPDLLTDEHAPMRVAEAVDDPLVIATLRDPVRRAVSAYYWYMQMGLLPVRDLATGMAGLLSDSDSRTHPDAWPRAREVLEFGRYAEGIERWMAALGEDRVVVLLPGDLQSDGWRRDLEAALGLSAPIGPLVHENAGVFHPGRIRVLRLRHKLLPDARSGDFYDHRSTVRYRAAWQVARAITAADRLVLSRLLRAAPAPLDPALTERLGAYYRADLDRLQDVLGRKVDWG